MRWAWPLLLMLHACGWGESAAPLKTLDLAASLDGEVLHANTLVYLGLSFQDIVAEPHLQNKVLTFDNCRASFYGGVATAKVSLDLRTGMQRYQLDIDRLDLATFLRSRVGVSDGTSGTVDCFIRLKVPSGDAGKMTGQGEIRIKKGNLLNLSPVLNLIAGDPSADGRDEAVVGLDIARGEVTLKAARITSPAGLFKIRGTIGLDGELNLTVTPYLEFATIKSVPGLGSLAAWALSSASSRLAQVGVRGHLSNPVWVSSPLSE